jgi:hypothetical protein
VQAARTFLSPNSVSLDGKGVDINDYVNKAMSLLSRDILEGEPPSSYTLLVFWICYSTSWSAYVIHIVYSRPFGVTFLLEIIVIWKGIFFYIINKNLTALFLRCGCWFIWPRDNRRTFLLKKICSSYWRSIEIRVSMITCATIIFQKHIFNFQLCT